MKKKLISFSPPLKREKAGAGAQQAAEERQVAAWAMAEGKRSEWAKKCHSVLKVSSTARRAVACKDIDVTFVMCRVACPPPRWRGGSAALIA